MFRPSMAIITELYLYPTKAIFMLKHSVKLRRYIYILGDVAKCLQWKGMFCNSIHPRLSLFVPFIVFYLQNLANPPPPKKELSRGHTAIFEQPLYQRWAPVAQSV